MIHLTERNIYEIGQWFEEMLRETVEKEGLEAGYAQLLECRSVKLLSLDDPELSLEDFTKWYCCETEEDDHETLQVAVDFSQSDG